MNPIAALLLLVMVVFGVAMIVKALIDGNQKKIADTNEQDQIRRVLLTLTPEKAFELAEKLTEASRKLSEKKKTDATPERADCYVSDVNGRGPCLVEIAVKKV